MDNEAVFKVRKKMGQIIIFKSETHPRRQAKTRIMIAASPESVPIHFQTLAYKQ